MKGLARIRPYQVETVAVETAVAVETTAVAVETTAAAEEALRPYPSKVLQVPP